MPPRSRHPCPSKRRAQGLFMGGLCMAMAAAASMGWTAEAPAPAAKIDFAREIAPLIKKYCFECHTGDEPEGEFSLWFETEADFLKRVSGERDHFKKMIELLRNYDMPPSDVAQPSDPERDRLVAWVERNVLVIERPAPRGPSRPAAAPPAIRSRGATAVPPGAKKS